MTQESDRYFLPKPAEIFTIELRARFVLRRLLRRQQRRIQLLHRRRETCGLLLRCLKSERIRPFHHLLGK